MTSSLPMVLLIGLTVLSVPLWLSTVLQRRTIRSQAASYTIMLVLWTGLTYMVGDLNITFVKLSIVPVLIYFLAKQPNFLQVLALAIFLVSFLDVMVIGLSKIHTINFAMLAMIFAWRAINHNARLYYLLTFLCFALAGLQGLIVGHRTSMVAFVGGGLIYISMNRLLILKIAVKYSPLVIWFLMGLIGYLFVNNSIVTLVTPSASNVGRALMSYLSIELLLGLLVFPVGPVDAAIMLSDIWPSELVKNYLFERVDAHNIIANLIIFTGLPGALVFMLSFPRWIEYVWPVLMRYRTQSFLLSYLIAILCFDTLSNRALLNIILPIAFLSALRLRVLR